VFKGQGLARSHLNFHTTVGRISQAILSLQRRLTDREEYLVCALLALPVAGSLSRIPSFAHVRYELVDVSDYQFGLDVHAVAGYC